MRSNVKSVAIRPIRTERDYRRALRALDDLWGALAGSKEGDAAEVWIALIAKYEQEHLAPIEPPDPVDAILFRLEQLGLDESALEGVIGSRTRVWEVLHRRRQPSLAMIRALHARFGIPLDSLIRAPSRRAAS